MNDTPKKDNKTKVFAEGMSRVLLRMLPFVPGPEIYDLIFDLSKSRTSLDEKVKKSYESLHETSTLISELEDGLKERVEKVEKLKEEYDRYSALAELEEDKAKALVTQLELTIGKGQPKERLISLFLNITAGIIVFVLGVAASPYVSKWLGITVVP
jgi:predicted RNase H-like nuclease (RuvC/YqgF family)